MHFLISGFNANSIFSPGGLFVQNYYQGPLQKGVELLCTRHLLFVQLRLRRTLQRPLLYSTTMYSRQIFARQ